MTGLAALARDPHRFDFYRAMRLIERAFPDRPRLGRSTRPADDPVRLGQQPGMGFAAGPVAGFEAARSQQPARLLVHFLGLLGPNGPLPLHLTEYVMDRLRRHGDRTLAAFLDLFHHRLLSLFWRAWAGSQPAIELDRPEHDRFAFYVGCLTGYAGRHLQGSAPQIDRVRRFWSGHQGRQVRNAEGLHSLLGGFFRIPARVEQFVGRWLPMPRTTRCRLGTAADSVLGQSTVLGELTWDCSQTVRIVLGPLDLDRYQRLLPGGDSWRRLAELVRSYAGDELAWEVRLVLRSECVPPLRLGGGQRLGWTSWLGAEPARRDPEDLVLQPEHGYHHDISRDVRSEP